MSHKSIKQWIQWLCLTVALLQLLTNVLAYSFLHDVLLCRTPFSWTRSAPSFWSERTKFAPSSPRLLLRTYYFFSISYQFLDSHLSSSASDSSSGITWVVAVGDFPLLSNTGGSAASAFSFLLKAMRNNKTNKVTVCIHKQKAPSSITAPLPQ